MRILGNTEPSGQSHTKPTGDVRVLVVIDRLSDFGGAEGSTMLALRHLADEGFDFVAITFEPYENIDSRAELERHGIKLSTLSGGRIGRVLGVIRAIRDYDPHFVHCVLFEAELVTRIAGAVTRVPVLASLVNMPYCDAARQLARSPRRLRIVQRIDGLLARHATYRFHAISNAVAEEGVRALSIDPSIINVVHRGRDATLLGERTESRRRYVRTRMGWGTDENIVINVARQDHQKGQLLLLEAFCGLREHVPRTRLVVVGRSGTASAALRRGVEELDLADQVEFLGMRQDVPDLLAAADCFALTSLYEGFGGVLIEALALEVPVVAFDIPVVREVVGGAARLVPPRDTCRMAQAMVDVICQPATSRIMVRRGRERFEEHFELAQYVKKMHALYRQIARCVLEAGSGRPV